MELVELFDKDYICINHDEIDQDQLFRNTCGILKERGIVEKEYLEDLMEREKEYPTGLKLPEYCVAIPHCSPKHVNRSVIFVNVMKRPAVWKNMEDFGEDIGVSVSFNLVLAENEDHMAILSQMIALIQNRDLINSIIESEDAESIQNVIRKELKQ